jgi:hypothetical protein
MRTDILARKPTGRPVLAVEVRARADVDERWAMELRRNLFAHGTLEEADFFMIVASDRTYLWRTSEPVLGSSSPVATIPTAELLGEAGAPRLSGPALEHLVSSWVVATASNETLDHLPVEVQQFLTTSGLHAALQGTTVAFEVA